jgi:hypothetical protein
MNYFNMQVLPHLKSPALYIVGAGLAMGTFLGKKILHKYMEKTNKKININDTIYFMAHFCLNMFCVYNCAHSVYSLIHNPLHLEKVPNTMAFYVFLFHFYHILLCGNSIKSDELTHHCWVFAICPLISVNYINLSDMGMFFLTGLPGGITYLLLSLKNLHYVKDITEKRISKHLNMWIRAPGCILTSYIIYLNYMSNNFGSLSMIYKFGVYLCMIGTLINGMYFASTIIESHGVARHKEKEQKQIEEKKLMN